MSCNIIIEDVLDNFTKANSTHCCDSSTFLKEINEVNSLIVSDFTSLVSKETRKTRSGLSCMRGGEIYKKKLDLIPEKGKEEFKKEQKKNREFIRTLTKQGNIMNQKLLNCTEEVLSYVNTKLSFMCFETKNLDNLFVKKDGKYSQPKDISESLLILDDACSPYLKQFNIFTDIVLNGYVDTVYNGVQIDQCNYYSSFFNFKPKQDKEDPYYPAKISKVEEESKKDFEALLEQWGKCAEDSIYLKDANIATIKGEIAQSAKNNPNGLSTYIGRFDIDYEVLKDAFLIENYKDFLVVCERQVCKAHCKGCSTKTWKNTEVVKSDSTTLYVSCCGGKTCVVRILMEDKIDGRQRTLTGAEIFLVNGAN